MAVGDFIQPVFQIGREIYIDNAFEIFLQQVRHFKPDFRRHKLLSFLHHILSLLDGIQNGGIGGRTADSLFFHSLDEAGFGVPWRWRSEMLLRFRFHMGHLFTLLQRRQGSVFLSIPLLFLCRLHNGEAVKEDVAPAGTKGAAAASQKGGDGHLDLGSHLAGDETVPDEGIKPELVP